MSLANLYRSGLKPYADVVCDSVVAESLTTETLTATTITIDDIVTNDITASGTVRGNALVSDSSVEATGSINGSSLSVTGQCSGDHIRASKSSGTASDLHVIVGSTTTGLYKSGSNNLGLSVAGTSAIEIDTGSRVDIMPPYVLYGTVFTPIVQAYIASDVVVANTFNQPIVWDTVEFQNGITFSDPSSAFVIDYDGYYNVYSKVTWAANATGTRTLRVLINGNLVVEKTWSPASAVPYPQDINYALQLSATDIIQIYALQSSGGNLNLVAGSAPSPTVTYVQIYRL